MGPVGETGSEKVAGTQVGERKGSSDWGTVCAKAGGM